MNFEQETTCKQRVNNTELDEAIALIVNARPKLGLRTGGDGDAAFRASSSSAVVAEEANVDW